MSECEWKVNSVVDTSSAEEGSFEWSLIGRKTKSWIGIDWKRDSENSGMFVSLVSIEQFAAADCFVEVLSVALQTSRRQSRP